ncbi:MAG: hypothetical protein KF683_20850 [Rubrivivax sp.]|nr:hypothetical protein [Rubrivivax sp.]
MKHPLFVPAAFAAALLAAGAALGHRWLQRRQAQRLARAQARALQTWDAEGGALPETAAATTAPAAPASPARRRVRASP